jgi:hypothetical protein
VAGGAPAAIDPARAQVDSLAAGGPSLRRKIRFSGANEIPKAHRRSLEKTIELFDEGGASEDLLDALTYLHRSSRSHLEVRVEPLPPQETAHGMTSVVVGRRIAADAALIQEQLASDPGEFLKDPGLTISVTIFVAPDISALEAAVTLLHELELHAVHAARLLLKIDQSLQEDEGLEKVINAVLDFMEKADEHLDLERLVGLMEGAGRIRDEVAGTAWATWGQGILQGVCDDAIQQFTGAALKTASNDTLEQLGYLKAVARSLEKGSSPPPPPKSAASTATPSLGTAASKGGPKPEKDQEIAALVLALVAKRVPWKEVVSTLSVSYGVAKATTIAVYRNTVVPWLLGQGPKEANVETQLRFLVDHGVPQSVALDALEGKTKTNPEAGISETDYQQAHVPAERRIVTLYSRRFELDPDEIAGDGDCFFATLIALGAAGGQAIPALRRLARENGGDPGIETPKAWAGTDDIRALAKALHVKIAVARLDLHYQLQETKIFGEEGEAVFVAHIFGGHFTPLRRKLS